MDTNADAYKQYTCICMYTYTYTCAYHRHRHIYIYTYITLRYIALPCLALPCLALHYITLRYVTYVYTYKYTSNIHIRLYNIQVCVQLKHMLYFNQGRKVAE